MCETKGVRLKKFYGSLLFNVRQFTNASLFKELDIDIMHTISMKQGLEK